MDYDFKGVWIPKEIWLDKNLTLQEKVLLSRICYLDKDDGCFASNQYFSEFIGVSKTRVSLIIKKLIDKGYIKSTTIYKKDSKEILNRVLNFCYIGYLTEVKEGIQEKLSTPITEVKEGMQEKLNTPIQQKLKDNIEYINIQSNNNINNNTYCSEPLQAHEPEVNQDLENQEDSKDKPTETAVITLILNDKSEYPIYQKDMEKWKDIYPNVDIDNEFRKIKGWCIANPTKRKTLRGINRFINSWLSKEQDKGKSSKQSYNSSFYYSGYENTNPTEGFSTEF